MKKYFALGIWLLAFSSVVWTTYDVWYNHPHGKWSSWRLLYSESKSQQIEVMKFENGWFYSLDKAGNPFDGRPANYTRCGDRMLKEIEEDDKGIEALKQ